MIRLLPLLLLLPACAAPSPEPQARVGVDTVDLARFFPDMEGTFVLYDPGAARYRVYNPERAARGYLPASTFKIPNALIALETGVVPDTSFTLGPFPDAYRPAWRPRLTLPAAFRASAVPFFQEVARRIGPERMQSYLDRFGYGNRNLSGPVDRFWLDGDLRISPLEQVGFLERFYRGELGLSERTTRLAKAIMLMVTAPGYRLYGKTGTAEVTPTRELGWLVGFVEREGAVAYFALNMEGERVFEDWPPGKRKDLVLAILRRLDALS